MTFWNQNTNSINFLISILAETDFDVIIVFLIGATSRWNYDLRTLSTGISDIPIGADAGDTVEDFKPGCIALNASGLVFVPVVVRIAGANFTHPFAICWANGNFLALTSCLLQEVSCVADASVRCNAVLTIFRALLGVAVSR